MEPYRTLSDGTQVFIQPPGPRDPYADTREPQLWRAYAILPDGTRETIGGRTHWDTSWHNSSEARYWATGWADAREAGRG